MSLTDIPKNQWADQWHVLACQDDGAEWRRLLRLWLVRAKEQMHQDSWAERHKDAARAGRIQRCADKARDELGCIRQPDGRYLCGLEGCTKICSLRAMRTHVQSCSSLTQAQRAAQAHSRAVNATRTRHGPSSAHLPRPSGPATVPRRRVMGKSKADAMGPCQNVDARNFDPDTLCRTFADRTRGHRQLTLTDLPVPSIPKEWPSLKCPYCCAVFPDSNARKKHVFGCKHFPYEDWLWRVRVTQRAAVEGSHACVHCGTKFLHAKAAGRHGVVCAAKRRTFGLPLNLRQWHDL